MLAIARHAAKPQQDNLKAVTKKNERVVPLAETQAIEFSFSKIPMFPPYQDIQTKLSIGAPHDQYEQQADHVAEKIVRMPHGKISPLEISSLSGPRPNALHKKYTEGETGYRLGGLGTGNEFIDRTLKSPGEPLDRNTRSFMETRFGTDFRDVRIHRDPSAFQSAKSINALAYTHQNDIVFGAGQYRPQTDPGKRLLAHELTHVVQQTNGEINSVIQRKPGDEKAIKSEVEKLTNYGGYVAKLEKLKVITKDDLEKFNERLKSKISELPDAYTDIANKSVDEKAKAGSIKELNKSIREFVNQDIAVKINKTIDRLGGATKAAIEQSTFRGVDDPLQKKIYFLIVMPQYFNEQTVEAVIDHFKEMEIVDGKLLLHKKVHDRYKMVAARMSDLGMPMPKTELGFDLRNRFNPDTMETPGMMVHVLGIAMDFRAAVNQHFKDPVKREMRDTIGDQTGRLRLTRGYEDSIKLMGEQMVNDSLDVKKAREFFEKFDAEFIRLQGMSEAFVEESRTAGITAKLQEGRDLMNRQTELKSKIPKLEKQVKSLGKLTETPKRVEQLNELNQELEGLTKEAAEIPGKLETLTAELPVIFKPWLDKINLRIEEIEKKIPEFKALPPLNDIIEGEENVATHRETRASLASSLNDAELPKMQKLSLGKLEKDVEFTKQLRIAKAYSKHFKSKTEQQLYFKDLQPVQEALLQEEQAWDEFTKAKKSDGEEEAKSKLESAREERIKTAEGMQHLPKSQAKMLSKALTKDEVRKLQKKFATILEKDSFDQTLFDEMQSFQTTSESLEETIASEKKELDRAVRGYKTADRGERSTKPELRQAFEAKQEWVRLLRLRKLRDRLVHDQNFVFGASKDFVAIDPSVWQMTKKGFFNPDKEPEGRKSLTSEQWGTYLDKLPSSKPSGKKPIRFETKEGFNLNFARLMALHGFGQGDEWSEQDTMHFELIEMKEKIRNPAPKKP